MLRVTKAWTNRDRLYGKAAGYGYAVWLCGVEPNKKTWWVIAHLGGRDVGFTGATLREVADQSAIESKIASDEDDNDPESWSSIEPVDAIAIMTNEMSRARAATWSREYADHFGLVAAEYELVSQAITGSEPVRKYERFTDSV